MRPGVVESRVAAPTLENCVFRLWQISMGPASVSPPEIQVRGECATQSEKVTEIK